MPQMLFDPTTSEIEFDLVKGQYFRVILVDGAMGGITPSGRIHMAIFNERQPIPQKIFHAVAPTGEVGAEKIEKREGRSGLFREVEADLQFDLKTAVALRDWLNAQIGQLESIALAPSAAPQQTKQ